MNTSTFETRLAAVRRRYRAIPKAARRGVWQIGERSMKIAADMATRNAEYAEVRLSEAEYFIPQAEALAEAMEEAINAH